MGRFVIKMWVVFKWWRFDFSMFKIWWVVLVFEIVFNLFFNFD